MMRRKKKIGERCKATTKGEDKIKKRHMATISQKGEEGGKVQKESTQYKGIRKERIEIEIEGNTSEKKKKKKKWREDKERRVYDQKEERMDQPDHIMMKGEMAKKKEREKE